ncbi:proline/serine-rich coiled-coil protein 1 [Elgaria multicarinata webbii]|uniref:proline/serine-rich coiled-coil protein 1 n=1 Tax=Elgaria multicarinata webbii TaxID=159646 RepID=UPI002FCCFC3D
MELSKEDITFITDETLEFGLFSPLDGQEEGDSIICPMEPRERCVAQTIDMNVLLGESVGGVREQTSEWSPLSPEKLEEVMKEANLLAEQLERCRLLEKETRLETLPELEPLPSTVLHMVRPSPRNPRRKTFNVNNSPLKALLPTVGPETCLPRVSPKPPFPKGRSPASSVADLLSSKRLQNKSNICNTNSRLSQKSGPSQSLKARATVTSSCKATSRSSRKDKPPPLTLPNAGQDQKPVQHLKPLPRNNRRGPLRKAEEASSKASSAEDPQSSLRDSSRRRVISVAHMRGKGPLQNRLGPLQTSPAKKFPAAAEKVVALQKASASQAKTMGADDPPSQPSSKPRNGSFQVRTRHTATSALASQLPVPKASSRVATLGRPTVPGRPSQLKPLSLGASGGNVTAMPIPAAKKVSTIQQSAPSSVSQNSRLRLPKKLTSDNSR